MDWNGEGEMVPFIPIHLFLFLTTLFFPGNLQRKGTLLRFVKLCLDGNNLCVTEAKLVELHEWKLHFHDDDVQGLPRSQQTPFN